MPSRPLVAFALAALAGCGGGEFSPDARVIDAGQADAQPGAPHVVGTTPADGATATAILGAVSVTFSEPMDPASITVNTGDDECSGSLQVSADGFGSCVAMASAPATGDDTTFEVVPAAPLLSATRYEIRVTRDATDLGGVPLAARFETGPGFTVRFYHRVLIDGDIDFSAVTDLFESSSTGRFIFVSHDDDNLYVGLEGNVADPGTGDRSLYFLFSNDPDLATGNTRSSDGYVKFGAAGTRRMAYHWKERISGGDATEFRRGDATGWDTDWGTTGKEVSKIGGYVEARIARSEFADPDRILITTYTVDTTVVDEEIVISVHNLLDGANGGDPTVATIDAGRYIDLALPSSQPPNHPSHLAAF